MKDPPLVSIANRLVFTLYQAWYLKYQHSRELPSPLFGPSSRNDAFVSNHVIGSTKRKKEIIVQALSCCVGISGCTQRPQELSPARHRCGQVLVSSTRKWRDERERIQREGSQKVMCELRPKAQHGPSELSTSSHGPMAASEASEKAATKNLTINKALVCSTRSAPLAMGVPKGSHVLSFPPWFIEQ